MNIFDVVSSFILLCAHEFQARFSLSIPNKKTANTQTYLYQRKQLNVLKVSLKKAKKYIWCILSNAPNIKTNGDNQNGSLDKT